MGADVLGQILDWLDDHRIIGLACALAVGAALGALATGIT